MPLINSSFTSRIRSPGPVSLLDYLARRFPYHDRNGWENLLSEGRLELAGQVATALSMPQEGQLLRFAVVDYEEPDVPTDFSILDISGELAFIHKPAGLPVHRTGKIFFQTLANLVREKLDDVSWAPLNRLDRETSGIVAFARGPAACKQLAPSNPATRWTKFYVAIVKGTLPVRKGIGRFEQALGESMGDSIRCRMHAYFPSPTADPGPGPCLLPLPVGFKKALTLYQVLEERDGFSRVILCPITGRKHQLRAHLAAANCPVVGDKIYSGGGQAFLDQLDRELEAADYARLGAKRHLLHAFHLQLAPLGQPVREAWDWETGDEMGIWDCESLKAWTATSAFEDMARAARASRETMRLGESARNP